MKRKNILCIVGKSGVGKDYIAGYLNKVFDIRTVVSFTTRYKRRGEVDNKEHIFISDKKADQLLKDKEDILAYTMYGGFRYFTLKSQLNEGWNAYIIDEKGLEYLKANHSEEFGIKVLKVVSNIDRNVDDFRTKRDSERGILNGFDSIMFNDNNDDHFTERLDTIYQLSKCMKEMFCQ